MYHKAISLLITATILFLAFTSAKAQTSINTSADEVIAIIGDMEITFGELKEYYHRNNTETVYSADELREFLPFFVEYKLKLTYGFDSGLDKEPELLSEFEEYAKQASYSYWLERDVRDRLFKQFKERSNYELKAYHLLIRLEENATPRQANEARIRLQEAREKFKEGTPIEELDSEYSTRMRGQSAGGQLPWFSAGTTVREFEDALYELEPGEISEPVRSQFGYHLIYLQEKRERSPDRLMSHIFIRSGNNGSPYETANEAFSELEQGANWEDVVVQYTEDGSTAQNAGQIGWIRYGMQFTEQFIESVYYVDPDADYSEPIETNYGYHIFRVDSVQTYRDNAHKEEVLRERMSQIPNYAANQAAVIDRIADVGNYTLNQSTFDELLNFYHNSDTLAIEDAELSEGLKSRQLFSFNDYEHTAGELHEWVSQYYGKIRAKDFDDRFLNEYRDIVIEKNIVDLTQKHFPEFERDIESYLNGLMVFRVSDDNIWNTATVDSTELKEFYNTRADQYQYPERYSYILLASRSDSTLNEGIKQLENGNLDLDLIKEKVTELGIFSDTTASVQDDPFTRLPEMHEGQISDKFEYRNRTAVIYLKEIHAPRKMTFEEAFTRAASDYQPLREELFMNMLKSKYDVRIYSDRIQ